MLTIKEEQQIELEIMQKFHCYCEQKGLKYVLLFGTLIGAVRHKGFIPWDNDMDVGMLRSDFNKFLEYTKNESIDDNLFIEHYSNDPKYHYVCIRICDKRTKVNIPYIQEQPTNMGVWIDIFPFDNISDSKFQSNIQQIHMKLNWLKFRTLIYGPEHSSNQFVRIVKEITKLFVRNKNNSLIFKIEKESQRFNSRKTKLAGSILEECSWWNYCGLPIENFQDRLLCPFEKYSFYIPKNYDGYLRRIYGDYMQLPPENKREVHAINAEWCPTP